MGPLAPVKYRTVHFGIRGEILNQQKNITNEKSRLVASQFLGLRPWVITLDVCLRIELANYFHFVVVVVSMLAYQVKVFRP